MEKMKAPDPKEFESPEEFIHEQERYIDWLDFKGDERRERDGADDPA
jgi:hypothetical protein